MPERCLFLVSVSSDLDPGATETVAVGGETELTCFCADSFAHTKEVCKLEALEGNFL